MKKITLIIMALVAMLAVSACGEATKKDSTKPKPAATASKPTDTDGDGTPDDADADPYSAVEEPTPTEDDLAPTEDESVPTEDMSGPKQTVHGMNDWGQDDGMRVKVLSMQKVNSIPPAPPAWLNDGIADKPGSSLVAVRLEVKNVGDNDIDPLCGGGSGFVLLDQNDRNFDPLDKLLDINDNVCDDGIQPGFKSTYTIAYRLPAGATIGSLVVWNSDADDDYDGQKSELLFKA
jgi:hypothetical protein